MGIVERREREKLARREYAIKAAMEIYAEEGYHGITMEKIAERAELSRAALYLYFKAKDEIFTSAIVASYDYFAELLREVYARRESIKETLLEELWATFQGFFERDPVAFNASLYFQQSEMMRHLNKDLREMVYEAGSRVVKLQHRIVAYGVEEGTFIQCRTKTLSEMIWASFLGIVLLERSKEVISRKSHLEITRDLALRILRRGILAKQV